jgi:hypothetical protein
MRSILEKHFNCAEYYEMFEDCGFAVVPLEGPPSSEVDFDAFLFTLKIMLPRDAKLVTAGGCGIHMNPLRDEYSMTFASKKWPKLDGGADIPRLHSIRLREAERSPSIWDQILPKRIREYIKGVRCARSAGHSWRYSFYCAGAFRYLGSQ